MTAYWALAGSAVTLLLAAARDRGRQRDRARHPRGLRERRLAPDRTGARQRASRRRGPTASSSTAPTSGSSRATSRSSRSSRTSRRRRMPGGFKGTVSGKSFSLSWSAAADNSGLISAYRSTRTTRSSRPWTARQRSVAMGKFKLTDKRSFQVAAVDAAGNVGPEVRRAQGRPQGREAEARRRQVRPQEARLQDRQGHVQDVERPQGQGHQGRRQPASRPAGCEGRADRLQGQGRRFPPGRRRRLRRRRRPIHPAPELPDDARPTPPPPLPAPTTTSAPPATTAEEHAPSRGSAVSSPSSARRSPASPTFAGARLRPPRGSLLDRDRRRPPRPAALADRQPPRDPDELLLWDQRIIQAIRRFLRLRS